MKFKPTETVPIITFLADFRNLCNANRVNEGTAIYRFHYFLGEPEKSLFSMPIVHPNVLQ